MSTQLRHIVFPEDLIREIDALVGSHGRNTFVVEAATAELRKRRMLAFLRSDKVIWKDEDHPELAAMDTQAWVKSLRDEWSTRDQPVEPTSPWKD